jgi:hypothetical protein
MGYIYMVFIIFVATKKYKMKNQKTTIYKSFMAFGALALLGSCASASQLVAVERNQKSQAEQVEKMEREVAELRSKTEKIEQTYQSVVDENSMLREKLEGHVPLTFVKSNGVLFEVMDVYRDGNQTMIEMAVTNKTDEIFEINMGAGFYTITDNMDRPLKVIGVKTTSQANVLTGFYQTLHPEAPIRFQIILENVKADATSLNLIAFNQVFINSGNSKKVRLSHVKIR